MTDRAERNTKHTSHNKVQEKNWRSLNFVEVYESLKLPVYRYILARTGSIDDAHDLTSQVFFEVYRNRKSYRRESSLVYWLLGIARHKIADHFRQQRDHASLSLISDVKSSTPSVEDIVDQNIRLQRVTAALDGLSEDRREAISLRIFAGLHNREISKIMHRSPDAVAMLVYRGIQDLRERLQEEDLHDGT